ICMKQCRKCQQPRNIAEFGSRKDTKDGLKSYCRPCEYEISEQWRKRCPETYALSCKKTAQKKYIKNRERSIRVTTEWAKNNKDKRKIICARHRQKNPHIHAANEAKRRAAKLNATPKWLTKYDFEQIQEFYKNRPDGYHVDHIVPLRGKEVRGLHVLWNLQYLLAIENIKNSN